MKNQMPQRNPRNHKRFVITAKHNGIPNEKICTSPHLMPHGNEAINRAKSNKTNYNSIIRYLYLL